MDERIKTVTLTLTQNCNLQCTYCYEHYKSQTVMNIDEAKRIIDIEFDNIDNYDKLEIDLFGGEPFLAFNLVQEIADYICSKPISQPCTIFLTTNGTLVHGKIQEWLEDHKCCVVCGLSLDGTREMHNKNRSKSYDDIDLGFFLRLYPQQDVKMTISKDTLENLAEGVIELHEKGFLVSCNLAYEIDWSASENVDILTRELEKLIDYYLTHPDIEPCSMLGMAIGCSDEDSQLAVRYCGAGQHMKTYDVDGKNYPCQYFMPLSIGTERAALSQKITFPEDTFPKDLLDDKCRHCVVQVCCPNCFGANYASTGNIYKRDENMCRLTKIMIKARSYFRAKQWELGQLKETGEELQALLQAIVKIQNELVV